MSNLKFYYFFPPLLHPWCIIFSKSRHFFSNFVVLLKNNSDICSHRRGFFSAADFARLSLPSPSLPVEETDDGQELAFTEDYLFFCRIEYNVCLSCRIFYRLDLFIKIPPFSLKMVKYYYTSFW